MVKWEKVRWVRFCQFLEIGTTWANLKIQEMQSTRKQIWPVDSAIDEGASARMT